METYKPGEKAPDSGELIEIGPLGEKWRAIPFGTSRAEADRQFVFGTIAYARGNKARAAAMLEVSRRGLYKFLERYEATAPTWHRNGTSHNGRNGTGNS